MEVCWPPVLLQVTVWLMISAELYPGVFWFFRMSRVILLLHLPCSQCYITLLGVEEAERMKASISDEEERQRRLTTIQRGVEHISSQLRHPNSS